MRKDFAVFILTHRRPDRVKTFASLRSGGYTGPIYLLVDDQDPTRTEYEKLYGKQVVVFDKEATAQSFDRGDNFRKAGVVIARNACVGVAKKLGLKYFLQLDDDYTDFRYKFDADLCYVFKLIKNLDAMFAALLRFYVASSVATLAIAQGGDFIGGQNNENYGGSIRLHRKAMNFFLCSVDRPFEWLGYLNEDVNTYVQHGAKGLLFLTLNQIALQQMLTQANAGGMTEEYLSSGTYVKSFYTVMRHPSGVRVSVLNGQKTSRIHHAVRWKNTTPMIVREELRKPRKRSKHDKPYKSP